MRLRTEIDLISKAWAVALTVTRCYIWARLCHPINEDAREDLWIRMRAKQRSRACRRHGIPEGIGR